MIRRLASVAGVTLLAAGLLAGCASTAGTEAPEPDETVPADSEEIEVEAAWLDGGRMIGIVTEGSSTCAPSAGEVTYDDGVLQVELVEVPADTACTSDLV